jgi:hypothetical protein
MASVTYQLNAANDEQPEWLVGNVGDISTAREGDHILLGGDHDCYDVFDNL